VRLWKLLAFDMGHAASVKAKRPVDGNGQPLPWYTYPAIAYLGHLEFSHCRVFEYGCGNSTRWWSERAKLVVSIEHSDGWASEVRPLCGANVTIKVRNGEEYSRAIIDEGERWDVIVIDGEERETCSAVAVEYLAEGGVLILDNSDWYSLACSKLRDAGLLQVDFHGFSPINGYPGTTSIFLSRDFRGPRKLGETLDQRG